MVLELVLRRTLGDTGVSQEQAADLALAGQTSSVTCISFSFVGAKKHSASCAGDGMLRLWCAAGGVDYTKFLVGYLMFILFHIKLPL
jgi:WD40 repeat protein